MHLPEHNSQSFLGFIPDLCNLSLPPPHHHGLKLERAFLQMCRADVQTCCFGLAASMGAFILGAGARGKRSSMPNARIMIHQPLGGASGQAVDLEIQAKEIMYHKANLNRIMAEYTGQPIEKVGSKNNLLCILLDFCFR